MNIVVDKNIYSDSVISKVVYWFSSEYIIKRRSEYNIENIEINVDNKNAEKIETKFFQLLNDYKLREVIAIETKEIKTRRRKDGTKDIRTIKKTNRGK